MEQSDIHEIKKQKKKNMQEFKIKKEKLKMYIHSDIDLLNEDYNLRLKMFNSGSFPSMNKPVKPPQNKNEYLKLLCESNNVMTSDKLKHIYSIMYY